LGTLIRGHRLGVVENVRAELTELTLSFERFKRRDDARWT
jgi:hypothetical protein